MKSEKIILTYSGRGMKETAEFLPVNFCFDTAKEFYALKRGAVFILTGFYAFGNCETDGPAGAFALYKTLENLGFSPIVITDNCCAGAFESFNFISFSAGAVSRKEYEKLIYLYKPSAVIAVERCGKNAGGDYLNMRGESIKEFTADLDVLFEICRDKGVFSVGIGDGGNEIGMGNLEAELRNIINIPPSVIKAHRLIVSTVSNWGAYGLCANLQKIEKRPIMPGFPEVKQFYVKLKELGFVDGMTGKSEMTIDGFDIYDEKEIYELLKTNSL